MKSIKTVLQNDKLLPWCIAAAGMLILGVLLPLNAIPATDTAGRYIPMARAFAEGNWAYAFHPHSGVLFAVLSGVIALLPGVDAFRGCQLAALLLWSLAAVPLYHIALIVSLKRETAIWCTVLYLLCSPLQRYVYDGLRDNGRSLGFFLLVWGILQFMETRDRYLPVFWGAVGCAILIMIRMDCVVFGIAGMAVLAVLDIKMHKWRCFRSAAGAAFCLLLILPQLYLNYLWSGYWVPNARYAILCEKAGIPPLGRGE